MLIELNYNLLTCCTTLIGIWFGGNPPGGGTCPGNPGGGLPMNPGGGLNGGGKLPGGGNWLFGGYPPGPGGGGKLPILLNIIMLKSFYQFSIILFYCITLWSWKWWCWSILSWISCWRSY